MMNSTDDQFSREFVLCIIIFLIAGQPTLNVARTSSSSSVKQAAPGPPTSSTTQSSSLAGTRVCILHPSIDHTAGFALSGKTSPPYIICQVEKNSPADKAGLLVKDALISINGKLVTEANYEDTVKLIKEALQKKSVELVVRDQLSSQSEDYTITQDQTKLSMSSDSSNNVASKDDVRGEPGHLGTNAVEEYQSM